MLCRLLPWLSLLLLPPAAWSADIGVSPVVVQLDKVNDRAAVSVVNGGLEPVIMQAEAIAWNRVGGADQDAPTGDLVINPPVFTIQPGQTRIVRVGLRHAAAAEQERAYRIVLREVPAPPRPGDVHISGQVRVLMALRVPIYVAPSKVQHSARWQASNQPDGSVVATVRNEGNVHLKVGRIQLRATDDGREAQAALGEQGFAAVVFPGEERRFRIRPFAPGAAAGAATVVEVSTDRGPQYVALEAAR